MYGSAQVCCWGDTVSESCAPVTWPAVKVHDGDDVDAARLDTIRLDTIQKTVGKLWNQNTPEQAAKRCARGRVREQFVRPLNASHRSAERTFFITLSAGIAATLPDLSSASRRAGNDSIRSWTWAVGRRSRRSIATGSSTSDRCAGRSTAQPARRRTEGVHGRAATINPVVRPATAAGGAPRRRRSIGPNGSSLLEESLMAAHLWGLRNPFSLVKFHYPLHVFENV